MKMNLRAAVAAAGIVLASGVIVLNAQNPAPDEVRMSSHMFTPGEITVKTSLVEVDTVVRDDAGRSVAGLRAEDFLITDNGKPQKVSGFTVQTLVHANTDLATGARPNATPATSADAAAPSSAPTTNPARFVAMFFDDLHTNHGDMEHARDAAKGFMKRGFEPGDHIGVFTASNTDTLDFTEDKEKINETLGKIAPHLNYSPAGDGCLKMTPYIAYVIADNLDPTETQLTITRGIKCDCSQDDFGGGGSGSAGSESITNNATPDCAASEAIVIHRLAESTWASAKIQSQLTIQGLERVVRHLGAMHGRRIMLMSSSGLVTGNMEQEGDTLLADAIQNGVVINSLDAKGLYAEAPGGSMSNPDDPLTQDMYVGTHETEELGTRLMTETAAMAILASGTGGRFFTNNNDLTHGFRDLAAAPAVSYLLGYAPQDVPADGKFHTLKVKVTAKGHYAIEARRGYFAPTKAQLDAPSPEKKLKDAVMGSDDLDAIPIRVTMQAGKSSAGAAELHVTVHVDPSHLPFQHQKDRSVEQLNFVAALFDSNGNFVVAKEAEMNFAFKAPTLEKYSREGMSFQMSLAAPAGAYQLRAVMQETVEGRIAAVTKSAEIQ
jgi:VWFA-related protein